MVLRFVTLGLLGFGLTVLALESNIVYWKIGSFSVSAYLTLLTPILLFGYIILHITLGRKTHSPQSLGWKSWIRLIWVTSPWLVLFLIGITSLGVRWRLEGLQNVLVLGTFVLGVLSFALADRSLTHPVVNTIIPIMGASLGGLFVLTQILDTETLIGVEFFSPRQYAMVAIISLSVALNSTNEGFHFRVFPYIIAASIIASASRTATAVAVLLFLLSEWNQRANVVRFLWRASLKVGMLLTFLILSALLTRDVAERFTGGGAEQTSVFSDSGRLHAWQQFLSLPSSWLDWIFGLGSGASAEFGQQELAYFPQTLNEYLRFLLDNGLIGLFLFSLGIGVLIFVTNPMSRGKNPRTGAGFTIVALALIAVTDGPFYSYFVVIPSAIVLGLGLSLSIEKQEEAFHRLGHTQQGDSGNTPASR